MPGGKGRRVQSPRRSSFRSVAALMLIPLFAFVVFLAFQFFRQQTPPRRRAEVPKLQARASVVPPKKKVMPPKPAPRAAHPSGSRADGRGEIVLILDDVGFDRQPLERAMAIDPNVNFSILPNAQHAAACARTLHAEGFEILCHLPMEPVGYPQQSPGANAIMTSMADEEIERLTREDVAAVPHARGVNNHMGSKATTDARVMKSVLTALPRGMYFIDSRTTSGSIAERTARELEIPTASRAVFLDDVQSEPAVRKRLADLVAAAGRHGSAIGIGHMYPVTVRVLTEEAPSLRERGFRFVRASGVVR